MRLLSHHYDEFSGFNRVLQLGRTSDSIPEASLVLNYIELPIAAYEVCDTFYNFFTDSQVCLQSVNRGSICQG